MLEILSSYKPIQQTGEVNLGSANKAMQDSLPLCKPNLASQGSSKNGDSFEMTYKQIHGKRDYNIKFIVNPITASVMKKILNSHVDQLERIGKPHDTVARWVVVTVGKGKGAGWSTYCETLIRLATGNKKAKCPVKNDKFDGANHSGSQKVDFNTSGKYLHATYWMKSNGSTFFALICIEKTKGGCTRTGVKAATSNRSECGDVPLVTDTHALAHITTIEHLPIGWRNFPNDDAVKGSPVEIDYHYGATIDTSGNKLSFTTKPVQGKKCIKFLDWKGNFMSTTEMSDGVPVISGKFSGCPFIKYRYHGKFFVTHIGTCNGGLGAGKDTWNSFYEKNSMKLDKIVCFDPFTDSGRLSFGSQKGGTVYAIADNSMDNYDSIYILNLGTKGMPEEGRWNNNHPVTELKKGNTKFKTFDSEGLGCSA